MRDDSPRLQQPCDAMNPDKNQEKRHFWGTLFRSKTSKLEKRQPPQDGPSQPIRPAPDQRRPPASAPPRPPGPAPLHNYPDDPSLHPAGKTPDATYPPAPTGPLTEWPPEGLSKDTELPLAGAIEYIARGASVHKGYRREVPHMPDQYFTLFSTSSTGDSQLPTRPARGPKRARVRSSGTRRTGNNSSDATDADGEADADARSDCANLHDSMTQFMTMRISQSPDRAAGHSTSTSSVTPPHPWKTLEQPSFAFCFGRRPGTITLNHWAGLSDALPPTMTMRDSGVRPRDIDLAQICRRLQQLQSDGLEEDDPDRLYRSLYTRLLRDPDRVFAPHRTLERQITDLILVLSRPDYWIDFARPRNQVVTRFIFDASHANQPQFERFFLQLLLSLELDLRIGSRHHDSWAKDKLMQQLPASLQWSLALARRWRDYVRVDAYGKTADQVRLRLKLKHRQIRMLRRFAAMMKWPNYTATVANLEQRDADGSLEFVSSHAMAFFSGLILPGPTFPFIIMNALIDVDPDQATDDLAMLTHLHPQCGFQYRNSYTYWTSTSIVGKVLAPTCHELAGWVGPARPTVDLGRSQIARIRTRRPRQGMAVRDVCTMAERSDPIGPPAKNYPVKEYKLVAADTTDYVDTVRIELLSLRPAVPPASSSRATTPASAGSGSLAPPRPPSAAGTPVSGGSSSNIANPRWFDAFVQFAIDGISWPMRLNYDVSFVCAWPCSNGPHPLFFDYAHAVVKADEVVNVLNWAVPAQAAAGETGTGKGNAVAPTVRFGGAGIPGPRYPSVSKDGDDEKVLVVEAFGVPDNEVLARAWCSHWGLSAIVADLQKTCMACAIREAYAATMTVVILVDGLMTYGDD